MLAESWTNILTIVLAGAVVVMGLNDQGKFHKVILYILAAAAVVGGVELLDLMQVFPDGTWMADVVNQKDIAVLVLLLLAVNRLKEAKK